MTTSLCNPPYYDLILVPVEEYRENPAFPVNEGYEAYTTIVECRKLVYDTLGHIARTKTFLHKVAVSVAWDKNLEARLTPSSGVTRFSRKGSDLSISIGFNPVTFYYITPDDRAQTIIHEACHAANVLAGEDDAAHGPKWVQLMELCGIPARVCSYPPLVLCWHGKCPTCGGIWAIHGPDLYELAVQRQLTAICRNCGHRVTDVSNATPPAMKPGEWERYMK